MSACSHKRQVPAAGITVWIVAAVKLSWGGVPTTTKKIVRMSTREIAPWRHIRIALPVLEECALVALVHSVTNSLTLRCSNFSSSGFFNKKLDRFFGDYTEARPCSGIPRSTGLDHLRVLPGDAPESGAWHSSVINGSWRGSTKFSHRSLLILLTHYIEPSNFP